ncbi:1840_t:CDS:1, partial [Funneliformis geosporum]
EKEVAKKAKEIYLQWGLHNEETISEKIESLIREYKAEDKGSPEWITFIEEHFETAEMYEAGMTEKRAKKILNAMNNDRFLIRVKFVRDDFSYGERHNYAFKIIDKYQPIRESKRVSKKFVLGGPNVILTKKTKPGFWVGIDEKFLVKIIQGDKKSEYRELDANAVVYGLYRIQEPDSKRLMPIKDGTLNCVAQRVIEHFEKAKRGYVLTSTRKQKIGTWEKRMHQPGARVEDVAELEKILKRPIKLLDITHGTIFNSGKYRT